MEIHIHEQTEERDRRLSAVVSFFIHLLLLFILLLPFLRFPIPPPGQEGILVSFGELEKGGNASSQSDDIAPAEKPKTSEIKEQAKSSPSAELESTQLTEETSPVIADDSSNTDSTPEKSEKEIRKEKEAEEAARIAREEAERKAEFERAKEEFGDLFGEGSGEDPGKQGDPDGNPDLGVLEGISTGSGRVGGGLSNRGLLHEPDITDNSQKEGKVVIKICVDQSGKVVSAKFTQRGSTTTDADLVRIALENSRKYVFSQSEIQEQCGTITVDFKLI